MGLNTMINVLSRFSSSPLAPSVTLPNGRILERRRGLPNGRAVVGGFLVAAGAVGIFAAYQGASVTKGQPYVTASHDIDAGSLLSSADLVEVAIDLPEGMRKLAISSAESLVGTTALAPVAAGQLIWRTNVVRPDGSPNLAQISIPIEPANALGGRLSPGERVDIIHASPGVSDVQVSTISSGARVVRVDTGDRTVGATGSITLVVAVPPDELEAIAQAAASGTITIARVTGLGWSDVEDSSADAKSSVDTRNP